MEGDARTKVGGGDRRGGRMRGGPCDPPACGGAAGHPAGGAGCFTGARRPGGLRRAALFFPRGGMHTKKKNAQAAEKDRPDGEGGRNGWSVGLI